MDFNLTPFFFFLLLFFIILNLSFVAGYGRGGDEGGLCGLQRFCGYL